MVGMTFARMKDVMPAEKNLRYLLHNHLNGPEKVRPLSRIHASELTKEEGFCPRLYALSDVTKAKPKDQWLSTSENVTFRLGREMQNAIVHWFADMGKAIGHWQCLACNHLHQFQSRPGKCVLCGSKAFKAEEVRFISEVSGASCGIDMLVNLGDPKLVPVEIKTMGKDQFKDLKAPLAEHRLRTNLYLRLIEESAQGWSNLVDMTRAIVLYIDKGGYGIADPQIKTWGLKESFSPFKEFVVSRNDKETHEHTKRAKAVTDFRKKLVGMPAGICMTALSKRAVYCPMKAVCFNGEHPPEYEWKDAT